MCAPSCSAGFDEESSKKLSERIKQERSHDEWRSIVKDIESRLKKSLMAERLYKDGSITKEEMRSITRAGSEEVKANLDAVLEDCKHYGVDLTI